MDPLSRAALAFFNQAGGKMRLDALVEAFAPVARAGGYTGAACHHIARPGHPMNPRRLFGWNLAESDLRMLEKTLSRTDDAISGLFMSVTPRALCDLEGPPSAGSDSPVLNRAQGLIIPVHGPIGEIMCVTILGRPGEPDCQSRRTLQTAATLLANRGAALAEAEADSSPADRPSRREAQCAQLALAGNNDWEIGRILGVSEDAVALHFDWLLAKFGVSRRAEIPHRNRLNIAQQDD